MDASLARDVRERAGHRCEYCQMPESNYPTVPFPIDHIIARQHGGSTTLDNLALSAFTTTPTKGRTSLASIPSAGGSPGYSTRDATDGCVISKQ